MIIVEADAKMESTSLTNVSDIQENIEILTPNGSLFQCLYNTLPLGLPTRVNQASQHEDLEEHSTFHLQNLEETYPRTPTELDEKKTKCTKSIVILGRLEGCLDGRD